jgi:hypothetical protein
VDFNRDLDEFNQGSGAQAMIVIVLVTPAFLFMMYMENGLYNNNIPFGWFTPKNPVAITRLHIKRILMMIFKRLPNPLNPSL